MFMMRLTTHPCNRSGISHVPYRGHAFPISPSSKPSAVSCCCQQHDEQSTKVVQSSNRDADPGAPPSPASTTEQAGKLAADLAVNPLTYVIAGISCVGLINWLGESELLIFFFALFPIAGLTALSKSSVGTQLGESMEAQLPDLEADAESMKRRWASAKARSPFFGPNRPQLPAAVGGSQPHLLGDMPGDMGFDPLGLWADADEGRRKWLQEAELLHARWAMLAVVGCLVPEILAISGADVGEPIWWKVGAAKLNSDLAINYAGIEGFRIAGNKGVWLILACQLPLMAGPEYARWVGINSLQPVGVFLPGTQVYPGGLPFDPLNFSSDADALLDQQVKEIKNGRLAMLAMLGFFVQALVTRESPLENLLDTVGQLIL